MDVDGQVAHHSANDVLAVDHGSVQRKERVCWPSADSTKWREVESEIVSLFEDHGTVAARLRRFTAVCYEVCAEKFGVESGTGKEEGSEVAGGGMRRARRLEELKRENCLRRR